MRVGIIISAAFIAAALTGLAGGAWAAKEPELRVFKPVADTYVTAARPRSNFGRSPLLRVDGAPETTTFLRFQLRRVRGKIGSVTLLLHSRTGRGSYAVRRVTDDEWRERGLTYENAPRLSLRYASSRPVRRGAWCAIDVTSFVGSGSEVNLAITTGGVRELVFGSRESSLGPRLVVRSHDDDMDEVLDALGRR